MIFGCPNCKADCPIPDERLRHRILKVRCRQCQHIFLVKDPQLDQAVPPKDEEVWFYAQNQTTLGPVTLGVMRHLLLNAQVLSTTLVWRDGLPEWLPLAQVPELETVLREIAPPPATGAGAPAKAQPQAALDATLEDDLTLDLEQTHSEDAIIAALAAEEETLRQKAEAEEGERQRAREERMRRRMEEAEASAAEEHRLRAEAEAKAEAEQKAKDEAAAKAKAEAERKAKDEAAAKAKAEAEQKAKDEAAAKAKAEAERKAKDEAAAKAKAEVERKAKDEAAAKAKAEVERKAKDEAAAKAKAEAERKAKDEAAAKAKAEAERKAKDEAAAKAKAEAERKAKDEAAAKAKAEAERKAKDEAAAKAKAEAERKAKDEAAAKAKAEAERKAKDEAAAKAKAEAERKAKDEAAAKAKAEKKAKGKAAPKTQDEAPKELPEAAARAKALEEAEEKAQAALEHVDEERMSRPLPGMVQGPATSHTHHEPSHSTRNIFIVSAIIALALVGLGIYAIPRGAEKPKAAPLASTPAATKSAPAVGPARPAPSPEEVERKVRAMQQALQSPEPTGATTPRGGNGTRPRAEKTEKNGAEKAQKVAQNTRPAAPESPFTALPVPNAPGVDPSLPTTLTRNQIMSVVSRNQARIQFCYENELRQNPGLSGRFEVEFAIAGNGRVSKTEVTSRRFRGTKLDECVSAAIKSWSFPRFSGETIEVVHPFIFSAAL